MCIIAVTRPSTDKLSYEEFTNCWDNNSDGFGMMWSDGRTVRSYKTLNIDEAYDEYTRVSAVHHSSTPIVLHFRIGTQGGNTIDNCHPFVVNDSLMMCHNGILSSYSTKFYKDKYPKMSDTRLYVNKVLAVLPPGFENNESTMEIIEAGIANNKFVMLNSDGFVYILNEKLGEKNSSGIWFSNNGYKKSWYSCLPATKSASAPRKEECPFCGKMKKISEFMSTGICSSCAMKYDAVTGDEISISDDCITIYENNDTFTVKKDNVPKAVADWLEQLSMTDWEKDFDHGRGNSVVTGQLPDVGECFTVYGMTGVYKVVEVSNKKYTCTRDGFLGTSIFYDGYLKQNVTSVFTYAEEIK